MGRLVTCAFLVAMLAGAGIAAESLAELMATARRSDGRVIFENDYVRVHNTILEYPAAPRRVADERPVVLYLRLGTDQGFSKTRLLELPRKARPPWQPGIVPLGIWIELLKPPPKALDVGRPGYLSATGRPREKRTGATAACLSPPSGPSTTPSALFRLPTVAVFLSDGVVEVSSRGLRRRMAVQAGYAEWFDERTRLTVLDDYTVGVAFLQVPTR